MAWRGRRPPPEFSNWGGRTIKIFPRRAKLAADISSLYTQKEIFQFSLGGAKFSRQNLAGASSARGAVAPQKNFAGGGPSPPSGDGPVCVSGRCAATLEMSL